MTSARGGARPPQYEIYLRSRLGETMRSAFPTLRAQTRGEGTVLAGTLQDQAALHGVLAGLETRDRTARSPPPAATLTVGPVAFCKST